MNNSKSALVNHLPLLVTITSGIPNFENTVLSSSTILLLRQQSQLVWKTSIHLECSSISTRIICPSIGLAQSRCSLAQGLVGQLQSVWALTQVLISSQMSCSYIMSLKILSHSINMFKKTIFQKTIFHSIILNVAMIISHKHSPSPGFHTGGCPGISPLANRPPLLEFFFLIFYLILCKQL